MTYQGRKRIDYQGTENPQGGWPTWAKALAWTGGGLGGGTLAAFLAKKAWDKWGTKDENFWVNRGLNKLHLLRKENLSDANNERFEQGANYLNSRWNDPSLLYGDAKGLGGKWGGWQGLYDKTKQGISNLWDYFAGSAKDARASATEQPAGATEGAATTQVGGAPVAGAATTVATPQVGGAVPPVGTAQQPVGAVAPQVGAPAPGVAPVTLPQTALNTVPPVGTTAYGGHVPRAGYGYNMGLHGSLLGRRMQKNEAGMLLGMLGNRTAQNYLGQGRPGGWTNPMYNFMQQYISPALFPFSKNLGAATQNIMGNIGQSWNGSIMNSIFGGAGKAMTNWSQPGGMLAGWANNLPKTQQSLAANTSPVQAQFNEAAPSAFTPSYGAQGGMADGGEAPRYRDGGSLEGEQVPRYPFGSVGAAIRGLLPEDMKKKLGDFWTNSVPQTLGNLYQNHFGDPSERSNNSRGYGSNVRESGGATGRNLPPTLSGTNNRQTFVNNDQGRDYARTNYGASSAAGQVGDIGGAAQTPQGQVAALQQDGSGGQMAQTPQGQVRQVTTAQNKQNQNNGPDVSLNFDRDQAIANGWVPPTAPKEGEDASLGYMMDQYGKTNAPLAGAARFLAPAAPLIEYTINKVAGRGSAAKNPDGSPAAPAPAAVEAPASNGMNAQEWREKTPLTIQGVGRDLVRQGGVIGNVAKVGALAGMGGKFLFGKIGSGLGKLGGFLGNKLSQGTPTAAPHVDVEPEEESWFDKPMNLTDPNAQQNAIPAQVPSNVNNNNNYDNIDISAMKYFGGKVPRYEFGTGARKRIKGLSSDYSARYKTGEVAPEEESIEAPSWLPYAVGGGLGTAVLAGLGHRYYTKWGGREKFQKLFGNNPDATTDEIMGADKPGATPEEVLHPDKPGGLPPQVAAAIANAPTPQAAPQPAPQAPAPVMPKFTGPFPEHQAHMWKIKQKEASDPRFASFRRQMTAARMKGQPNIPGLDPQKFPQMPIPTKIGLPANALAKKAKMAKKLEAEALANAPTPNPFLAPAPVLDPSIVEGSAYGGNVPRYAGGGGRWRPEKGVTPMPEYRIPNRGYGERGPGEPMPERPGLLRRAANWMGEHPGATILGATGLTGGIAGGIALYRYLRNRGASEQQAQQAAATMPDLPENVDYGDSFPGLQSQLRDRHTAYNASHELPAATARRNWKKQNADRLEQLEEYGDMDPNSEEAQQFLSQIPAEVGGPKPAKFDRSFNGYGNSPEGREAIMQTFRDRDAYTNFKNTNPEYDTMAEHPQLGPFIQGVNQFHGLQDTPGAAYGGNIPRYARGGDVPRYVMGSSGPISRAMTGVPSPALFGGALGGLMGYYNAGKNAISGLRGMNIDNPIAESEMSMYGDKDMSGPYRSLQQEALGRIGKYTPNVQMNYPDNVKVGDRAAWNPEAPTFRRMLTEGRVPMAQLKGFLHKTRPDYFNSVRKGILGGGLTGGMFSLFS